VSDAHRVQVSPLRGSGPVLSIIDGEGSARAVIWPGSGAIARSLNWIWLAPSSRTVLLEHGSEAVYYIMHGSGSVLGDGTSALSGLVEGSMVHVDARVGYRLVAGADGLEFFGGPCPADPALYSSGHGKDGPGAPVLLARSGPPGAIKVLHRDRPSQMLPLISSDARMIVWPGIGAWTATMNYVRMQPGEENTAHTHQDSEDTIVILEGRGSIDDLTNATTYEFAAGDVIHVPAKVHHAVRANRGQSVVSAGGPCPADLAFLRLCGAQIPEHGTTALEASGS
jgi:quercetin dioxygenase-like cupin family protein